MPGSPINKLASSVDAIAISKIWKHYPPTDWPGKMLRCIRFATFNSLKKGFNNSLLVFKYAWHSCVASGELLDCPTCEQCSLNTTASVTGVHSALNICIHKPLVILSPMWGTLCEIFLSSDHMLSLHHSPNVWCAEINLCDAVSEKKCGIMLGSVSVSQQLPKLQAPQHISSFVKQIPLSFIRTILQNAKCQATNLSFLQILSQSHLISGLPVLFYNFCFVIGNCLACQCDISHF